MKITEIAPAANRIIKKLNDLWITYASYGSLNSYNDLNNFIEVNSRSEDDDVLKNIRIYDERLKESILNILRKI